MEQLQAITSWDDVAAWLRAQREISGHPSYSQLTRTVRELRGPSGHAPGRATVHDCFASGRRRMDIDLVVDLARALGTDSGDVTRLRRACEAVQTHTDAANVVSVTWAAGSPGRFVGREAELEAVTTADKPVVISGMPGVGKSRLALEAALARVRAGANKSVLIADLRGHHASRPPADGEAMLDELLRTLTGAPVTRSAGLAARQAQLAAALASQRVVLVLDDAVDASQTALVLGEAPFPAIVTTRRPFVVGGLHIDLDPLPAESAADLLVPGCPPGEIGTARAIADLLGGLPLALEVTAIQIAAQQEWSLSDHEAALAAQLERLRLPESLTATLDLSYAALSPDARAALRLLAAQPTNALDLTALAVLTGAALPSVAPLADELTSSRLAQEISGRLTLHALVKAYAAWAGLDSDPPSARDQARRRLLEHYVDHTRLAVHAAGAAPYAESGSRPEGLPDPEAAEEWLATEIDNIVALASAEESQPRPQFATEMSELLARFLESGGRFATALTLHRHAVTAAAALRDVPAEVRARTAVAATHLRLGEPATAAPHLDAALTLAESVGDPDVRLGPLNVSAVMRAQSGHYEEALRHFEQALAAVEAGAKSRSSAAVRGNIASCLVALGRLDEAADQHERARDAAVAEGDLRTQANVWSNLSEVRLLQGHYEEARQAAEEAQPGHLGPARRQPARGPGGVHPLRRARGQAGPHLRSGSPPGGARSAGPRAAERRRGTGAPDRRRRALRGGRGS